MIRASAFVLLVLAFAAPQVHAGSAHGEGAHAESGHNAKPAEEAASKAKSNEPQSSVQVRNKEPVEIVRSMQVLQDQMVLGSTAAQAALPGLSAHIADRLIGIEPDAWRDGKNARAAATYVFSGGQPRVVRRILDLHNSPDAERKLMEGALAYVEGRELRAKQLLGDIDPRTLPPAVGAHLALVQAALMAGETPRKAMQLLDVARLIAPGTLVEEAALRREIVIADEVGDLAKFVNLSSQYVRRFKKSVYSENFRQRFATSIVHFGLLSNQEQFAKLDLLLSELEPEEKLGLYLLVSQSAIVDGKLVVARDAAEKAFRLSQNGSAEIARSQLYDAAAMILSNNYEKGLSKIQALDVAQLPPRDLELKSAVMTIAQRMRYLPDASKGAAVVQRMPLADDRADPANAAAGAIDLAQKALSDSDTLLKDAH